MTDRIELVKTGWGELVFEFSGGVGFTPSELELDVFSWRKLIKNRESFHPLIQQWLSHWDAYDFVVSPLVDEQRKFLRHGHYLGFFETRRPLVLERQSKPGNWAVKRWTVKDVRRSDDWRCR